MLTETWIKSESEVIKLMLPNYTHYYNFRKNTRGGGVSIFVHESMKHSFIEDLCEQDNHFLWIHLNKYCLDIGVIYKPERTNHNDFIETYTLQVQKRKRIILFGDFNYNLLKPDRYTKNYINVTTENGLQILNSTVAKYCTRETSTTKSTLDHVCTNIKNHKFNLTVVETAMSDHKQLYLEVGKYIPTSKKKIKYQGIDYKKLYSAVEHSILIKSSDTDYQQLEELLKKAVQNSSITKYKIQNSPRSDWINKDIIYDINRKNKLWHTHKQNPNDEVIKRQFLEARKEVGEQIQIMKSRYYYKAFKNCEGNSLKMWKLINILAINKIKTKSVPLQLNTLTGPITDIAEICNCFNNYFVKVGVTLANQINMKLNSINLHTRTQTSSSRINSIELLQLSLTSEDEISKIIENLKPNTSTGMDGINCKAIKCVKNLITSKLVANINQCLISGRFPDSLKIAKVSPIYKSGHKSDPENYRPISVLSTLSKIFEKVIYNRLDNYLKSINFLSSKQYGFRGKSNTLSATIDLITNLKNNIDNKRIALGVFIDLKKAFDTISHELLLLKLYNIGIRGKALEVFRSYLSDRYQVVKISGVESKPELITYGVPQGSILGPLLFLIYINDIHSLDLKGDITLYADDSSLFYFGNKIESIKNQAQDDLDRLYSWFQHNLLTVNIAKTKYIVFSAKNKKIESYQPLTINMEPLTEVTTEKYLGLILDNRLTWKPHLEKLQSKLSSIMGTLRGTSRCFPKSVRYIIYNSMVKPHLDYLIEVWGSAAKTHLKSLQITQNKIIKQLFHYNYLTPTDKVYKETKLMTILQTYTYNTCMLVHKILNKDIHSKISFTKKGQILKRKTRQSNNIYLRPPRTSYGKKNILYEGAQMYNKLPSDIRQIQSYALFKKTLKFHILKDFVRH